MGRHTGFVRGSLATRSFDFHCYGETRDAVLSAMAAAWATHQAQTGATGAWAEFEGDVQFEDVVVNVVFRDGTEVR